ncbi:MAG: TauD/TfdA family dioxygenase [Rhodospirillales bacterium]
MSFTINPLSETLGVEVIGLDLRAPIDAATQSTVFRAFVENAVIVFRGQDLKPEQFVEAARTFGVPLEQLLTRNQIEGCPFVNSVSNQEKTADGKPNLLGQTWHTDHSFWPNPPMATLLHAITLPEKGGNTCFSNMRLAYETLPESLRARIKGLKAVHAYREDRKPPSVEERARAEKENPSEADDGMVHPVVRTHPDTGDQAIYINPLRIKRFLGLSPEASARLVEELTEHATQEKFVYRHTWKPGDLVMWDNRSVMHMADVNYDITQPRLLHRIILEGDRPI